MLLDFIDLEFLKLQYILPWNDNPMLYNDLFVQSVRSLLVKNGGCRRRRRHGPGQAPSRGWSRGPRTA